MSWTIIYGHFFVTFSLPGNKALNKDKLLKGWSRSLLVTRALLLLLNRLPSSNIRVFSFSSFHFTITCWTWQGVIHHCCSEVWRAAAVTVLLCKGCTSTSSCSEGPRANRQQRGGLQCERKLKSRTGFLTDLVTCECLLVARFPAVPWAWRLSCHLLCTMCLALPITAFFTGFGQCWWWADIPPFPMFLFSSGALHRATQLLGRLYPGLFCEKWRNCLEISLVIIW